MASRNALREAALGFRAKTGRAIVVALATPKDAPELLWKGEVALTDPQVPETAQPYHEVMERPWKKAEVAVQPFVHAIEDVASSTLASLIAELRSNGVKVRAVG